MEKPVKIYLWREHKASWQKIIPFLIIVMFLFACSPSLQPVIPQEASRATEVHIDSPTSAAPTLTQPPTDTPVPSSTPEPSPTIPPTATNTPALTRTPTVNAAATQQIEALNKEINSVLTTAGINPESGYLIWKQNEPLDIALNKYQEWIYVELEDDLVASNFILKTDITWESTSGLVTCGFFFRSEKNIEIGKQYIYEMLRLSGMPAWEINFLKNNEYVKSITQFQTSSAIHQENGSTNKLILIADEDHFTLYINDMRMGSYYDFSKSMVEGYFAFSAWQESGKSSCTFTDTWIWSLEPPETGKEEASSAVVQAPVAAP